MNPTPIIPSFKTVVEEIAALGDEARDLEEALALAKDIPPLAGLAESRTNVESLRDELETVSSRRKATRADLRALEEDIAALLDQCARGTHLLDAARRVLGLPKEQGNRGAD